MPIGHRTLAYHQKLDGVRKRGNQHGVKPRQSLEGAPSLLIKTSKFKCRQIP